MISKDKEVVDKIIGEEEKDIIDHFIFLEETNKEVIERIAQNHPDATNERKELECERSRKWKEVLQDNVKDEMEDYIHDAVLCFDDGDDMMPKGYTAIIFDSHYSAIFGSYKTLAKVYTPNNTSYYIAVRTCKKAPIGMIVK